MYAAEEREGKGSSKRRRPIIATLDAQIHLCTSGGRRSKLKTTEDQSLARVMVAHFVVVMKKLNEVGLEKIQVLI
ncbi:unnamed protein product [Musa hybrid cultivar]